MAKIIYEIGDIAMYHGGPIDDPMIKIVQVDREHSRVARQEPNGELRWFDMDPNTLTLMHKADGRLYKVEPGCWSYKGYIIDRMDKHVDVYPKDPFYGLFRVEPPQGARWAVHYHTLAFAVAEIDKLREEA